jgi:hypothetical protein
MLLFQMSLDLVRPHRIHAIFAYEHLPFFRMMEILHGTGVIGYGRGPRLVARDLRVAFGLWVVGCGLWVVGCGLWVVGCGLWVMGYGLRAWVVGYGFGAWVMGLGRGLWVAGVSCGLRAVGYGSGAWVMGNGSWDGHGHGSRAWVTDMGMGIGYTSMRVAFRFGVRLFHFHILVVMNSRWIAA